MTGPEDAAVRRIESLFAAIRSRDLDGIERCYWNAPGLLVFVEGPRTRNVSWESIKRGWRHFIDAKIDLRSYEWGEDRTVKTSLGAATGADFSDMAFVAATNRYHWMIDGRPHTTEMRGTWVLGRFPGEESAGAAPGETLLWRIMHEHGSFPHPDPYGAGDWLKAERRE
jgi:ketosteroid isomerase-like protein